MTSISIRESIRWLPEPASEPTSTVVLTSPGRRFVDVRLLRPSPDKGAIGETEGELPISRLDWAFAGYSHSETRNGTKHCFWRHFVDSRSGDPDEVTDEGDMFPREDGLTLETGRMVNPATGRETDYEEVWADIDPRGAAEGSEPALESLSKPFVRCVVLELKQDERKERGMVVCLGEYCQGVVRKDDAFTLERWQWIDGGWKRRSRIGSLWLPCVEAMNEPALAVGSKVKREEQAWNVVEVCDL
ncbi:hypothetical protein F5X99DRAFT_402938 [Biscogniauxia marginata]|nr:hypothetical protein F5X99DRAFT_402938 [Biscogniauxia marginata]